MTSPAIFLDRDGVINRAFMHSGVPRPPASLRDLTLLPRVPESLTALRALGYCLVVVTNQPDVARGVTSRHTVDSIHDHLLSELDLDAILTCFHDDCDDCDCRKPKPGLLLRAARRFDIDLAASFMIGDRWRDIEAGRRAGCRTFFIDHHYESNTVDQCDFRVESLAQASQIIRSRASAP